ncbi:MAG: hypothetical protein ACLUQ0_05535 [Enterococcus italicus]|uniref:hypothetical protein n=1 Tax=Enterococcus italicus TaxID=246144 RepID=UPI003993437A
MPVSIKIVHVNRFEKSGYIINAPTQLLDEAQLGYYEGEGVVSMTPSGEPFNMGNRTITPYWIEYDYKNEQSGFVFEKNFRYFFTKYEFKAYLTSDNLFILDVKKKIANAFLKELSKETHRGQKLFSFSQVPVDFSSIIAKSGNISGLWSKVNRSNLTTQAFFGDNVIEDDEVKIIIESNETSFVQFSLEIQDQQYKLGITASGNIVLYSGSTDLSPENTPEMNREIFNLKKINLVLFMYDNLLT